MSDPKIPLLAGCVYHVFNRGINSCNLFRDPANYEHFLELYNKYISPIADTYAWVLMPNHFHLLIRIKEDVVYKYSNADRSIDAVRFDEIKWQTTKLSNLSVCEAPDSVINKGKDSLPQKIPKPHLHFSHLFNAYSKYFNYYSGRHGSLFERPFERKKVIDSDYFRRMVLYIHCNPIHHKFTARAMDYPWSSYLSCISVKTTKLSRETSLGHFNGTADFIAMHEQFIDNEDYFNFFE